MTAIFIRISLVQVLENVLAQDDSHIDHRSDGNRDSRQCNDVGIDAECLHGDEDHEYGQWQQCTDKDGATQVQHHHQNHDDGDENFFGQCRIERAQRFIDDASSVVEGDDSYLAGCDPVGPLVTRCAA